MKNVIATECVEIVRRAVANWPSKQIGIGDSVRSAITVYLANSFDSGDFRNTVSAVSTVISVDVEESRANVIFLDVDDYKYRATLVRGESKDWKLEALKFECPACFGDGVNDGRQCTLCGGLGWGVGS